MATQIFLGEPPANIKRWIEEHAAPAEHADTWYKYAGDTDWRIVSISGTIEGDPSSPTSLIPDVANVVELELGSDVIRIDGYAFMDCKMLKVSIPNSINYIGDYVFMNC